MAWADRAMTGMRRVALEASRRLPAVQDRKAEVHQNQIGRRSAGDGEALLAVRGHDDLETGPLEAALEHGNVVLVVLDIQDLSRKRLKPVPRARRGGSARHQWLARARGALACASERHIVGVQEPAYGKSRLKGVG
jgi:hypothetical protein